MEWLHTPLQIGLTVAMAICLAGALWKGDRFARVAAIGLVAGSVLSGLVQDRSSPNAAQWGIMVIDAVYLAVLIGLAWTSGRRWPVWAAAFQLAQVVTHISLSLNPEILGRAYIITSYLLFAGLLGAVFVGLMRGTPAHEGAARDDRRH